MTIKAGRILQFVADEIAIKVEDLPDGKFYHGSKDDPVNGILITWMATDKALKTAIESKLNLVICHEVPFFDELPQLPIYRWTADPNEKPAEGWGHPNRKRRETLKNVGKDITLLQIHYGLDRLCIFPEFARLIELGVPISDSGYETVFELQNPTTVRQLAKRTAKALNFKSIRIVGDLDRQVSRAGALWGGVGLSQNLYWMRKQIEHGAEVLIAGESDEVAMFFAKEYDIPLIVTAHAITENPGLSCFTTVLKKRFPNIPVEFHETHNPFIDLSEIL